MTIQPQSLLIAGILLLALVTVESGGYLMTRIIRGKMPANELQQTFFRAGHAHAGVLIILALAILSIIDNTNLEGIWLWMARSLVPTSAILMPAGFFFSVMGRDPKKPNRFIVLLWIGAGTLATGLTAAGVGLVSAAISAMP